MRLEQIKNEEFDGIYDAMEAAFPYEERRDRAAARALLGNPRYRIYHTVKGDVRVGFVAVWVLGGVTFLEHFVMYPAYRNRGYGTEALALLKRTYGYLVLEAEHPKTEMAARRLAFYGRSGFVASVYPYVQPSYHGEGAGVPLVLLSFPTALKNPAEVAQKLRQEVYGQ